RDGVLLMRAPFDGDVIGRDLSALLPQDQPLASSGASDIVSPIDGLPRLIVYRQVGDYPLLLIEGTSLEAIFSGWWRQVPVTGSLILALCALPAILFAVLSFALRRRAAAEHQLALIASTDALTGLGNRRRFDAALEAAWRRAERQASPISLI